MSVYETAQVVSLRSPAIFHRPSLAAIAPGPSGLIAGAPTVPPFLSSIIGCDVTPPQPLTSYWFLVGCISPFMRLAEHLTVLALDARNVFLVGEKTTCSPPAS